MGHVRIVVRWRNGRAVVSAALMVAVALAWLSVGASAAGTPALGDGATTTLTYYVTSFLNSTRTVTYVQVKCASVVTVTLNVTKTVVSYGSVTTVYVSIIESVSTGANTTVTYVTSVPATAYVTATTTFQQCLIPVENVVSTVTSSGVLYLYLPAPPPSDNSTEDGGRRSFTTPQVLVILAPTIAAITVAAVMLALPRFRGKSEKT